MGEGCHSRIPNSQFRGLSICPYIYGHEHLEFPAVMVFAGISGFHSTWGIQGTCRVIENYNSMDNRVIVEAKGLMKRRLVQ